MSWVLRKVVFIRGNDWNQSLEDAGTYGRFEEFLENYASNKPSLRLGQNGDYNLFREGIVPDFDDPSNVDGSRFTFKAYDNTSFDNIWLRVVKFIMTARFNGAENINGALVKIRTERGTAKRKISIWTKDSRQDQAIKDALRVHFVEKFENLSHKFLKQLFAHKRK